MPKLALPAHFDGERILLDEPFRLPKNARLMIVVLSESQESESWSSIAKVSLGKAFGDDEPDYSDIVSR